MRHVISNIIILLFAVIYCTCFRKTKTLIWHAVFVIFPVREMKKLIDLIYVSMIVHILVAYFMENLLINMVL